MHRLLLWWIGSLLVVAGLASAVTQAQATVPRQGRVPPMLLSGPDVGFRVEGLNRSGQPIGTMVVRMNGEWVEVGTDTRVHPIK